MQTGSKAKTQRCGGTRAETGFELRNTAHLVGTSAGPALWPQIPQNLRVFADQISPCLWMGRSAHARKRTGNAKKGKIMNAKGNKHSSLMRTRSSKHSRFLSLLNGA